MISDHVRKIINKAGLSPEEFATTLGVGKSSIYKLLRGDTHKLTVRMARKISSKYPDYTVESLLSLNGEDRLGLDEMVVHVIENEEIFLNHPTFKAWLTSKSFDIMRENGLLK